MHLIGWAGQFGSVRFRSNIPNEFHGSTCEQGRSALARRLLRQISEFIDRFQMLLLVWGQDRCSRLNERRSVHWDPGPNSATFQAIAASQRSARPTLYIVPALEISLRYGPLHFPLSLRADSTI